MNNLYPVGHLSLQCSYQDEICEISNRQNKTSINAFNMFASPSRQMSRHPQRRFALQM